MVEYLEFTEGYQIGSDGSVWSLNFNGTKGNRKPLATKVDRGGYEVVNLPIGTRKVHRLVALAFIPNFDNKPQVNHIDGNKLNNNRDNLEWVTAYENTGHAYITGLISSEAVRARNRAKAVAVRCVETNVVYQSAKEAAEAVGLKSEEGIRKVCNKQKWHKTAKGLHWEWYSR